MIQIFKIIHNLNNVQSDKYFHLNDNITRGHIDKLVVPRTNKQLRRNLFLIRCITLWNKLSEDIVLNGIVLTFKPRLDREWLHKRFDIQKFMNSNRYKQTGSGK